MDLTYVPLSEHSPRLNYAEFLCWFLWGKLLLALTLSPGGGLGISPRPTPLLYVVRDSLEKEVLVCAELSVTTTNKDHAFVSRGSYTVYDDVLPFGNLQSG